MAIACFFNPSHARGCLYDAVLVRKGRFSCLPRTPNRFVQQRARSCRAFLTTHRFTVSATDGCGDWLASSFFSLLSSFAPATTFWQTEHSEKRMLR